jgi:peptidoglycan/LPS O-acetylase OafA/YrhL
VTAESERFDAPTLPAVAVRPENTVDSAAPPPRASRPRIMGLDGPRGVACVAVLVVHVGAHYSPQMLASGKLQLLGNALVFFFALSGFLLYLPYVNSIMADRDRALLPDTKKYALHRFLRVFPAYLVILLFVSYVLREAYVQNALEHPYDGAGMLTNPLQLVANVALVQTYIPAYFQTGLNPSWSLTLELVFYATLPILATIALRYRRRTGASPLLLAMFAPLVLLAIGMIGKSIRPAVEHAVGITDPNLVEWGANWAAVFNRSFLALADNFTFGMVAAVVFVGVGKGLLTGHVVRRMRWYVGALLLPAVAVGLYMIMVHSHFSGTVVALCAGLIVLFIVAPIARGEFSRFARWLDWRPFAYLGEISLSVYLLHFPLLLFMGRMGWMSGDTWGGFALNVVLVLTASVLLASATYRWVEKPAMVLAKRIRS